MSTRKSGQALCIYYDGPSSCEYAVRVDGVVFYREPVNRGRYGWGMSAWRLATADVQDWFVGLPSFKRIGFVGVHRRLTSDLGKIRLPL